MMSAYGLETYIWNINFRSALLLAGFPVLLLLLTYALFLLFGSLSGYGGENVVGPFVWAAHEMSRAWPFALAGAATWFAIAYLFHQKIIDASVGARGVTRKEEPALYNLLENLCISRGIPTPTLRVIETDALNAFSSGVQEQSYSITVTRGLMRTLTKEEMEAVLAHELTHIRNRDVRLLVIAVIFVGIFSFIGEVAFRSLRFGGGSSGSSSSNRSRGSGGGGAALAVIAALILIALSYALAIVIRFSLSRRREYLADAGAVELTKNPDALISALRKISGNSETKRATQEVQ